MGVILNLALWFGLRVLFRAVERAAMGPIALDLPVPASLDPAALGLAALAAACLFWWKLGLIPTLGIAAVAGLALHLAGTA